MSIELIDKTFESEQILKAVEMNSIITKMNEVIAGVNKTKQEINTENVVGEAPEKGLRPNTFYIFGECTSLTITLAAEIPGIYNEYMFQFSSGDTPTVLNVPDSIKWIGGKEIMPNKTYQVSIVLNKGVIGGV